MININNKRNLVIMSVISLISTILICGGTYAWYVWSTSDDEQTKIVTSLGAATIYYDGGSSINGVKLRPVADKANGVVKTVKIKTSVANRQKFNLYLDITSLDPGLQHESFKFAIYKGSTLVKEGDFSSVYLDNPDNTFDCTVNAGVKHIYLLKDETISTSLTTYTLYLWIDGVNYINPNEMQNKSFSFTLHASGEDAIIQEGKIPDVTDTAQGSLAYNLITTYNSAEKEEVLNNGIIYHYDRTNRLMSDTAGNLRFFGSDDTTVSDDLKNYIYFNCDDYANQTPFTCEIWRIIGVFDGKVKIMRNSSIGSLANRSDGGTYSGDWSNSSLQQLLNGKYYDRGETTTLEYDNGSNSTKTLDLSIIGIKDSTRNLISESIWYLKGDNSVNANFSNEWYDVERKSGGVYDSTYPTIMAGNIGIPYASDYGYAADFASCSLVTYSYSNNLCASTNWMKSLLLSSWLLGGYKSNISMIHVASNGSIFSEFASKIMNVFPVVHLSSELGIEAGDGSQYMPYQLAVEDDGSNDTQIVEGSFAHQLISTYNSAEKEEVVNNSIMYHYDRSNRLMLDIAGNLRFFGADDTSISDDLKNYIYFNCSDYSNQSSDTCELWRIIGVFDGKVKIMRNTRIEKMSWDQDKNNGEGATTYNNDWRNSSLQQFLNGKYFDRGETTTLDYYSGTSGSTKITIDLETIGIKDSTRELISETLWHLRGVNSIEFSDQLYSMERRTGSVYDSSLPSTMPGYISLPYASDYGYAADFASCNVSLNKYNDSLCTGTNWFFSLPFGATMTRYDRNSSSSNVIFTSTTGSLTSASSYSASSIYPTLHLSSEQGIMSGDGSQDTPYQLLVE